MQIEALSDAHLTRLNISLSAQTGPTMFNSPLSYVGWLSGNVQVVFDTGWIACFCKGDHVELMDPIGDIAQEEATALIDELKTMHPGCGVQVFGVSDDSIELFDKTKIDDIQPTYILSVSEIVSLTNKKLRNAVSRAKQHGLAQVGLQDATDVIDLVKSWATRVHDSTTEVQERLIELFKENDDNACFVLQKDGVSVGAAILTRDVACPEYAILVMSAANKDYQGVSEYLLHLAATKAQEWGCTYLNYGGANPKDEPGLHTYKKKFGYAHVIMDYTLWYE